MTSATSTSTPLPLTLIVAATSNNGIGLSADLPWRLPKEMAYFAKVTKAAPEGTMNAVIMGRKSWESIPTKWRPLGGRVNVVVSGQESYNLGEAPSSYLSSSLPSAVSILSSSSLPAPLYRTFLIGGAQLYSHSLTIPHPSYSPSRILLTRIHSPSFDCDVFFPDFLKGSNEGRGGGNEWEKKTWEELCEWVGFDVPKGVVEEVDRNSGEEKRVVKYEFEMWVKKGSD